MDTNPYAAPAAMLDPPGASASAEGAWTLGDVAHVAWRMVKNHWAVVFFISIAISLIKEGVTWVIDQWLPMDNSLTAQAGTFFRSQHFAEGFRLLGQAMVLMIGVTAVRLFGHSGLEAMLVKAYQAALRDEPLRPAMALRGMRLTITCALTQTLCFILILMGLLACVLPVLFAVSVLAWAPYFAAEAELGTIDSLKASWRLVRSPMWWRLALIALVPFGIHGVASGAGLPAQVAASLVGDLLYGVTFALATGRIVAPSRQGEFLAAV